jgi:hypothetical protein
VISVVCGRSKHRPRQRAVPGQSLRRVGLGFALWLVAAQAAGAAEVSPAELENRRCLNCHGQKHIASLSPRQRMVMVARPPQDQTTRPAATEPLGAATAAANVPAVRPKLFVTADTRAGGVHAKVACVDCHKAARNLPHPPNLGRASCNSACHVKAESDFMQGPHAEALAKGDARAPTYLAAQYRQIAKRRGKKRAIIAVGHSILVAAYHMLAEGVPYRELGGDYFDRLHPDRLREYYVRRLKTLGFSVELTPADEAA